MIHISFTISAFISMLLLVGCGTQEISPTVSEKDASSGGEFFPYYPSPEFRFVGSYVSDHVYIRPDQTARLRDGILLADTFLVTENFAFLAYRPSTKKAAIFAESNSVAMLADSDFIVPPHDSLLEKILKVHASQHSKNGRTRSGENRNWLYVGLGPDLHTVYISTADGVQLSDATEIIPMLLIKEQRCLLYIDPKTERFAPVNTDQLGTPKEEIAYRPIRPGQMEDKIWEIIRKSDAP